MENSHSVRGGAAGGGARRYLPIAVTLCGGALLSLWAFQAVPDHEQWQARGILMGGLLLTFLLAVYLLMGASRAAHAQRLVDLRTAELSRANEALEREIIERRKTEAAAIQAHRGAEAFLEVSQALTLTLDLDLILDLVVEKVFAVTGADACAIARETAEGDLEYVSAKGFGDAIQPGAVFPCGQGLVGRCVATQAPAWTRDVLEDPTIPYSSDALARVQATGVRAALAVPILTAEELYGVLIIGRRAPYDHTREDVALAEGLAAKAAIAIQSARLYEESQRRAREATALASTARDLAASLQEADILQRIAEHARLLTGSDLSYIAVREGAKPEYRIRSVTGGRTQALHGLDRKSTRLNSSHT